MFLKVCYGQSIVVVVRVPPLTAMQSTEFDHPPHPNTFLRTPGGPTRNVGPFLFPKTFNKIHDVDKNYYLK